MTLCHFLEEPSFPVVVPLLRILHGELFSYISPWPILTILSCLWFKGGLSLKNIQHKFRPNKTIANETVENKHSTYQSPQIMIQLIARPDNHQTWSDVGYSIHLRIFDASKVIIARLVYPKSQVHWWQDERVKPNGQDNIHAARLYVKRPPYGSI